MDDATPDTPPHATARTTPHASPRRASAALGAALALPAVALVVLGAGAGRPAWSGDGAWTTPLEVLLGVAALGSLVAAVLVLRHLPGRLPHADGRSERSRWWLLAGAVAVGALAWLSGVAARDPASTDAGGGEFGLLPGLSGEGVAPLPTSTTAVLGGLLALGLLAATAVVVLRRQTIGPAGHDVAGGRQPDPAHTAEGTTHVPDSPPEAVVLVAWAVARRAVLGWLGDGEHDPPGVLLRRVAGTPAADPLRTLTELYLPVRYGRTPATTADAATARRALAALEQRIAATGARP